MNKKERKKKKNQLNNQKYKKLKEKNKKNSKNKLIMNKVEYLELMIKSSEMIKKLLNKKLKE